MTTLYPLPYLSRQVARREARRLARLNRPQPKITGLSTRQAAEMLDKAPGTLKKWRTKGIGPAFYKQDGACFYHLKDLEEWLWLQQ